MTNFAQHLTTAATEDPDRLAVGLDDQELNYAELERGAAHAAGLLRAKGRPRIVPGPASLNGSGSLSGRESVSTVVL
jgi:non-ribosomal peptide synthetase component E (peptide arylation enzyme)